MAWAIVRSRQQRGPPGTGWGVECRGTLYRHHKVFSGLGLGILSHTSVGASLSWLQVTQLETPTSGDHAVHRVALWNGRKPLSPAHPSWTDRETEASVDQRCL